MIGNLRNSGKTTGMRGHLCAIRLLLAMLGLALCLGFAGIQRCSAQEGAAGTGAAGSGQSATAGSAAGQEGAAGATGGASQAAAPGTSGAQATPGTTTQGAPTQAAPGQGPAAQPAGQNPGQNGTRSASPRPTVPNNDSEPQQVQQPVPYSNIPSLAALYTQVPTGGGKPTRFGSEVFSLGTGNANELTTDVPVGPDYVLGEGDSLAINLWGSLSTRLTEVVDRQGQVTLPEAGSINISGMTISQAQNAVQTVLNTQYRNEHVEISLGRIHTVRVYIVGDVQRPGAYDVSSLSSPLAALYAAGGPTARGSLRILRQYRGKDLVREIDLYDFLLKGVHSNVERLLPGDTLMVPPAGSEVTVEGMVHHPAIYELNGEQNLSQVLNLTGGVLGTASLKEIKVQRLVAHERRTMLDLQLSGDMAQMQQELAAFKVQGGDDIVIAQILPYNQSAVFLEGHVYRPGTYSYKDGMTIAELLHSYQDVLPEPSDHAELVRLVAPDFHPETKFFNLHDALTGNDSFALQPFDVVRVYGRYEIDGPTVSIRGEVVHPGTYPMSQGMTMAGLVRMAGGFLRSAFRDTADLSSYHVENGQKVLVSHNEIALDKVLSGDAGSDVPLHPGDVVSIRQLAGWQDIGSSVTINGEVEHAGTYSIMPGERLSAVLKRAGGFRDAAYPAAAVLERVQVRELAEQQRVQMIRRIQNTPVQMNSASMNPAAAEALRSNMEEQRNQALMALRNEPVNGRLVINISEDVQKWANTAADIELRAGDTLIIPKRPNFVAVAGQVYNPAAISYVPGKDVAWYLRKSGGPTRLADKRLYVLHADGSVVPRGSSWNDTSFMHMRLRPGDTIFVPEKVIGGSPVWQNIIGMAQVMTAAAMPLAIAGVL
jgi:protein involved in polysaccharide export with SLBB domain